MKEEVHDLRDEDIEIVISADGEKLWINTASGCVLRAQKIPSLILKDSRTKDVKK